MSLVVMILFLFIVVIYRTDSIMQNIPHIHIEYGIPQNTSCPT